MRYVLAAVGMLFALASVGCSASADEGTVKPGNGVALNPGGKPRSADESALASQMQKGGEAINAQRDKDALAIEAAKARSGGK